MTGGRVEQRGQPVVMQDLHQHEQHGHAEDQQPGHQSPGQHLRSPEQAADRQDEGGHRRTECDVDAGGECGTQQAAHDHGDDQQQPVR
jgi:hypothetical protein